MEKHRFPQDFKWGASTSAYQIEGAFAEDGRGESIWDRFSHTPGNVTNNDTGDVACDHYHRFAEDVELLVELGIDSYRFSISWPRIVPTGSGPVNQRGIDFYDRLVDVLLERGIEPWTTLYHWDLPQALQDAGGWAQRDTVDRFAEFVDPITRALGDRVTNWFTINEPWVASVLGNGWGIHAPGHHDWRETYAVGHNLMRAHGRAVEIVRANVPDARVGLALNLTTVRAASNAEQDVAAAGRLDGFLNRWFLDVAAGRGYPADMAALLGANAPDVLPGDLEAIAVPTDFLAINYYFPAYARNDPNDSFLGVAQVDQPDAVHTATDWVVEPEGLRDLLIRVDRDYEFGPLYVTENGAAFDDPAPVNGQLMDPERTAYIEAHLDAVAQAIAAGVPAAGYFVWSLLDNFEWAAGYDKRFGIVAVDFATQTRTIKASGHRYRALIAANRV